MYPLFPLKHLEEAERTGGQVRLCASSRVAVLSWMRLTARVNRCTARRARPPAADQRDPDVLGGQGQGQEPGPGHGQGQAARQRRRRRRRSADGVGRPDVRLKRHLIPRCTLRSCLCRQLLSSCVGVSVCRRPDLVLPRELEVGDHLITTMVGACECQLAV